MKRKKWWRSSRVSILVLLVLCSFGITNAEEEIHKVGLTNSSDNLVTYNGQASYSSGWSNGSRTKPTSAETDGYVWAKVYLPVTSGNNGSAKSSQGTKTYCSESEGDTCSVTKFNGTEDHYKTVPKTCDNTYCDTNWQEGYYKDCGDYCRQEANVQPKYLTGSCVPTYYQNNISCSSGGACKGIKNEKKCYYGKCKFWHRGTKDCSYTEFDYKEYKYSTSTQFAGGNGDNRSYGRASQMEYSKEIYVYSYPITVNVQYDGNGATGICDSGAAGSNTLNLNTSIKYELGNPVCSSAKTAAGKMSNTTINYKTGGNISKNQYYRNGYDFKGGEIGVNGQKYKEIRSSNGSDGMYVTRATFNYPKAGSTVILKAIGEKHTYTITYDVICGTATTTSGGTSSNGNLATYQIGQTVTLPTDVVCTGMDANTKFLGGYTTITSNSTYTGKMATIPNTYFTDITLHARQRQKRYYNYQEGSGKDAGK